MTAEELRAVLKRDVLEGARRLLGCEIHHPGGIARIVETEAYRGSDDPGCHAFGKTKMKNMALFGPPGHAYVYLSYGMHQMLNVACLSEGDAAGVLIRALRPTELIEYDKSCNHPPGRASDLYRGPGRLARALGVTPAMNGLDLLDPENPLWIEPGAPVAEILAGPRIGLAPGKGETLPWRYVYAAEIAWVSATRKGLATYCQ